MNTVNQKVLEMNIKFNIEKQKKKNAVFNQIFLNTQK